MRETIGGFYDGHWFAYIGKLLVFAVLAFALGLGARPKLANLNRLFAREIKESDMIIGEPVHLPGSEYRVTQAIAALADRDEYRHAIERRAAKFAYRYPRLLLGALIAGFVVPAALIIVFVLTTSEKIVVMGTWLAWVLIIMGFLMVVEFMRDSIRRQTELATSPTSRSAPCCTGIRPSVATPPPNATKKRTRAPPLPQSSHYSADQGRQARTMNTMWKLFTGDIKRLTSNVVSIIIVIGLVMIPGLFTWFNVAACWDPFSNMKNLKFAVANVDEGYRSDLIPVKVTVGDQVVNALRANSQLDWTITSKADAVEGARSGKYYAAIVIPKSFSKDMMTFFSDDVQHAELTYYRNEKKNALAPNLLNEGTDEVAAEINTTFAKTITSAGWKSRLRWPISCPSPRPRSN